MNIFLEINKIVWPYLNNFVIENWLEKYISFFADFPIFFLPIFLLWYRIFYTHKNKNDEKRNDLMKIFITTVIAISINLIIQNIFHLDRPESIVTPILEHVPDASFPSDHAAVSFAFLFAILLTNYKKSFWLFLPFVILMNFSRIAWWIHWFFDVIVWMIIWLISALLILKIFKNNIYINNMNASIMKILKKINF